MKPLKSEMNSDKLSLQPRNNHMAMLGAFGVLPGEAYGIDRAVMNATMHAVWELWEWESTWSCAPPCPLLRRLLHAVQTISRKLAIANQTRLV